MSEFSQNNTFEGDFLFDLGFVMFVTIEVIYGCRFSECQTYSVTFFNLGFVPPNIVLVLNCARFLCLNQSHFIGGNVFYIKQHYRG